MYYVYRQDRYQYHAASFAVPLSASLDVCASFFPRNLSFVNRCCRRFSKGVTGQLPWPGYNETKASFPQRLKISQEIYFVGRTENRGFACDQPRHRPALPYPFSPSPLPPPLLPAFLTRGKRFSVFLDERRSSVAQILFRLKPRGERWYGHVTCVQVNRDFRGMGLGPLLFKEVRDAE